MAALAMNLMSLEKPCSMMSIYQRHLLARLGSEVLAESVKGQVVVWESS
jgi:hypothetical protein